MSDISFETHAFTDLQKSIDEKSKEKLKKIQGDDPQINEICERIDSSSDIYEIIEDCVKWKILQPTSHLPDIVKAESYHRLKQNEKAQELFKNIIKNYETYGYVYERYGNFLLNIAKYDEALECFDSAIEIDRNNVDALNGKGIGKFMLGRRPEALGCFEKSLEVDPSNVIAWDAKGVVLSGLGRHQEALECIDKLLEVDPSNAMTLVRKGSVLSGFGRHQEALECIDKSLEVDPSNVHVLNGKGVVLSRLGKLQEAVDCFDTALEVDMNNENRANILNGKGIALFRLGKHQEAVDCFDTALEVDMSHMLMLQDLVYADALVGKAGALFCLGKHQEALETSEKLLNMDEKSDAAIIIKSMSLDNLGKTQDAIKWMEGLEEEDGKNLDFHHWNVKAEMLDKLKKYPDSIACYKKSLSIEENEETRKSLNVVIEKQNQTQKENTTTESEDNEPQWIEITIQYPGKCKECKKDIVVGDRELWKKGEGVKHVTCNYE